MHLFPKAHLPQSLGSCLSHFLIPVTQHQLDQLMFHILHIGVIISYHLLPSQFCTWHCANKYFYPSHNPPKQSHKADITIYRWQKGGLDFLPEVNLLSAGARTQTQACFFKKIIIINLFIYFGCVGSSFLCEGFLQLRQAGATLHHGARASHCRGLSCCGAQAPDAQAQ